MVLHRPVETTVLIGHVDRCKRKTKHHLIRSDERALPRLVFWGMIPYLKSYSKVALAMICNSSLFVVNQRYFRPSSGLGPDRGITLPER